MNEPEIIGARMTRGFEDCIKKLRIFISCIDGNRETVEILKDKEERAVSLLKDTLCQFIRKEEIKIAKKKDKTSPAAGTTREGIR